MIKRIAQAWAFSAILLLSNYIDQTSTAGDARMRSPVALTRVALAHLTDILLVALIFAALLAGLRILRAWPRVRWVLTAGLPIILLLRNLNLLPFDVPVAAVWAVCTAWIATLLFLILRHKTVAEKVYSQGSSLLTGLAIFALVMTWQLGRATLWRPGPQAFSSAIPAAGANRPRLVWIIFDELAYKPVFEDRDPSLRLPNLDRLRNESTLYTDMTPIAYRTTRAIPSLLVGQPVTDVAYTAKNEYLVQTENGPHWKPFDVNATLFGMARDRGISTSVVGWYVAYCPILAKIVNDCYWSNDDAQDRGPTSLDASFAENVWFPLKVMVEQAFAPSRAWADVAEWNAQGHIASVKDLQRHALETAATSQADILYLHLPAPHPPAFWDRKTGTFATGGSYLDSLAFTDKLLGQILDVLEAQPRWQSTTLIVQGDHSWRTEMWRPLPGWSAEDERISHGGQWNPRPVLMVHEAGEKSGKTTAAPTSVMFVHDRVAAAIRSFPATP